MMLKLCFFVFLFLLISFGWVGPRSRGRLKTGFTIAAGMVRGAQGEVEGRVRVVNFPQLLLSSGLGPRPFVARGARHV